MPVFVMLISEFFSTDIKRRLAIRFPKIRYTRSSLMNPLRPRLLRFLWLRAQLLVEVIVELSFAEDSHTTVYQDANPVHESLLPAGGEETRHCCRNSLPVCRLRFNLLFAKTA